ncbi:hypothetical protein SDC9_170878 [bioreactor metagenome]|uniref:GntR C-terminal domain-containing protein n=2 Tax=root TaxID=1 RepID=A0A645GBR3_9ZZZZ
MVECCTKLTPETQQRLQEILNLQQKTIEKQDARGFFHADNLFHETCFDIAERKEVWNWLDNHNTHLERFRWLRVTISGLPWENITNQHQQLFDALVAKNPEEVRFLTILHLHMMLNEQESVVERYPEYFA